MKKLIKFGWVKWFACNVVEAALFFFGSVRHEARGHARISLSANLQLPSLFIPASNKQQALRFYHDSSSLVSLGYWRSCKYTPLLCKFLSFALPIRHYFLSVITFYPPLLPICYHSLAARIA
jgi:hypothetical protein